MAGEHRTALAGLAEDYRAGRLPEGDLLTLPPDLRSLSPSGWAYASPTQVFVQMWQDWRHESGTGFAYFADPPTKQTMVQTAEVTPGAHNGRWATAGGGFSSSLVPIEKAPAARWSPAPSTTWT